MSNLQKKFTEEVILNLKKSLEISNSMAIPKLSKIVVNAGVKNALSEKKNIERMSSVLSQITGQKPRITKAKKAISSFKLREGDEIGLLVTLRGKRMYGFFEKITSVVLPRLRDFHGVKKESFDGHGNYALGLSEYTVFPEIDPGKVDVSLAGQGLEICISTTAKDNKEGFALFKALGMPFEKVKS